MRLRASQLFQSSGHTDPLLIRKVFVFTLVATVTAHDYIVFRVALEVLLTVKIVTLGTFGNIELSPKDGCVTIMAGFDGGQLQEKVIGNFNDLTSVPKQKPVVQAFVWSQSVRTDSPSHTEIISPQANLARGGGFEPPTSGTCASAL